MYMSEAFFQQEACRCVSFLCVQALFLFEAVCMRACGGFQECTEKCTAVDKSACCVQRLVPAHNGYPLISNSDTCSILPGAKQPLWYLHIIRIPLYQFWRLLNIIWEARQGAMISTINSSCDLSPYPSHASLFNKLYHDVAMSALLWSVIVGTIVISRRPVLKWGRLPISQIRISINKVVSKLSLKIQWSSQSLLLLVSTATVCPDYELGFASELSQRADSCG
jgi:hypothetical protein